MRYLLFCTLIFLSINSTAQNNEQPDRIITNSFADTTNAIQQNDLHKASDSNKHFYLIKIENAFIGIFKKQSKTQIKRQLNANWFIIEANENSIQQNKYIEKYFLANNFWKLSPTLLNNKSKLPADKNLIFIIKTNDNTLFESFIR